MNWKPQLTKIEINKTYIDSTNFNWSGCKHYNWLCINWRKKISEPKDFEIIDGMIKFDYIITPKTRLVVNHNVIF